MFLEEPTRSKGNQEGDEDLSVRNDDGSTMHPELQNAASAALRRVCVAVNASTWKQGGAL